MFEIYPVYEYQIAEGAEGIDSDRFAKCLKEKEAPVTGTYTGPYVSGFYDFGSFQNFWCLSFLSYQMQIPKTTNSLHTSFEVKKRRKRGVKISEVNGN